VEEILDENGMLPPFLESVAASDGTLYRSAWAAFLHDLIELKDHEKGR
jgi:hypothetical protein